MDEIHDPEVADLIKRSSLGTPDAEHLAQVADDDTVASILRRAGIRPLSDDQSVDQDSTLTTGRHALSAGELAEGDQAAVADTAQLPGGRSDLGTDKPPCSPTALFDDFQKSLGGAPSRLSAAETGWPQVGGRQSVLLGLGTGKSAAVALVGLVARYLKGLIEALDTDPWTRRAGGTAARISLIESNRRLVHNGRVVDSVDAASSCDRLVVLGPPGQGKTWLARSLVVRAAREALSALSQQVPLDDVEIPLFATCASLSMDTGEPPRRRVVRRSLERSGLAAADAGELARRLSEHPRVLVVLDGLDEAHLDTGALEPLVEGPGAARAVVTSRPAGWRRQLRLDERNPRHIVGQLQPLDDAEIANVITRWLVDDAERAATLLARLRESPTMATQARNPLLLAMYCLAAESGLPTSQSQMFDEVVQRLLGGPATALSPRVDEAAGADFLRRLAWAGALDDPVTGQSQWAAEIEMADPDPNIADTVSNVIEKVPARPGQPSRWRFVHRSIREHFLAAYISSLPMTDAVDILIPRLWFDRDWDQVVPRAVAAHLDRDALLLTLLQAIRATSPPEAEPIEIELDLLLGVAEQVRQGDGTRSTAFRRFSPDLERMMASARRIAKARTQRRRESGQSGVGSFSSVTAVRPVRLVDVALTWLDEHEGWDPAVVTNAVLRRGPADGARAHAVRTLLDRLAESGPASSFSVAAALTQLALTEDERTQTRRTLLDRLAESGPASSFSVAAALTQLALTEDERTRAHRELVDRLADTAPQIAASPEVMALA